MSTWRAQAACRGTDTETFFPEGGTVEARRTRETAREVCRGCPVWEDCLREALAVEDFPQGVRGGYDGHERHQISRGRLAWPSAPAVELHPYPVPAPDPGQVGVPAR